MKKPGIGSLLFACLWLTLWSAGVAFIQSSFLEGGVVAVFIGIFVITHGGSEILAMAIVTSMLYGRARTPGPMRRVEDVGGMRLSWRQGSSSVASLVISVVLPIVVYVILFSPLVSALVLDPSAFTVTVVVLFSAVWLFALIWFWIPTWRAQIAGLGQVILKVDPHTLSIHTPGLLRDSVLQFPAWQVHVGIEDVDDHAVIELVGEDRSWKANVPKDAAEEVRGLRSLLDDARAQHEGAQIPEDLRALRDRS